MSHESKSDPTPFQTTPILKNVPALSDSFEYAMVWTGQSNSRVWGYPADLYEVVPELELQAAGQDLSAIIMPDNTSREVGMVEEVPVDSTVSLGIWNGGDTYIRFGTPQAPLKGYGRVLSVQAGPVARIEWITVPANGNGVTPRDGYLIREDGKWMSYEAVRVLTPYLPIEDIIPPILPKAVGAAPNNAPWLPPANAEYPSAGGTMASGGRRLVLPAPFNGTTSVTQFSDLGAFLPATRREGQQGYGFSEIADSTFTAGGDPTVNPTGHPIVTIAGNTFTIANALSSTADLTNAYIIVDWEDSGEAKRSWGRVTNNASPTTFVTDPAAWLGDGVPMGPAAIAISSVDSVADTFTTTGAHGLSEGDRIAFDGGTAPTGAELGRVYFVRNPTGTTFQISLSMSHPTIDLTSTTTPTNVRRTWIYSCWIPYWKDNPHMWLPGPEFAYPNEDHQPQNSYIHFRARGQEVFAQIDPQASNAGVLISSPFDGEVEARVGAMIPCAYRMSVSMGKRVNMIALGINSTPLGHLQFNNTLGHTGVVGWWDAGKQFGFGVNLSDTTSTLAHRIKRLIEVIAPQALLAESNSKSLRYLSHFHVQGEGDSAFDNLRESYGATLTDFKEWVRRMIEDGGWSPFSGRARMPFIQPMITHNPWEDTGVGSSASFFVAGADTERIVNNFIRELNTADEFSDWVITEDLPKLVYALGTTDNGHYSGQGMGHLGLRLARSALALLDHALGYSSPALTSVNSRLLSIANRALQYVGQGARRLTSLVGTTQEVTLINDALPEAIGELLARRQWSWAMRLEAATQVQTRHAEWLYAYVVPGRAVNVVEIIPPDDTANTQTRATFVSVLAPISSEEVRQLSDPEEFETVRSWSGHRLLMTNVPRLEGDESESVVVDGKLHPERLPTEPQIRYVDKVVDPDRYSDNFAEALAWLLAAKLTGDLIRGPGAMAKRKECLDAVDGYVMAEAESESAQRNLEVPHVPDHIRDRY